VIAPTESARPAPPPSAATIDPNLTLWLLSLAHAVNHAQAVLLPLVYIRIIAEFGVTADTIALLAAAGSFASGAVQLSYAKLTRMISRRRILAAGGVLFGGGFALQAAAPSFPTFAAVNVTSRIGGSPQHPVGNGLLAEQFPEERRGFAISAHISGGNVGTVVVAVVGAPLIALLDWRPVVVLFGIPAVLIALAILLFVRETGEDRAAAVAHGSVRDAFRTILRDPDHRWVYLASILGGGGRGLGVVNLFALLYLSRVLLLPPETSDVMYGALIVFSVPMPLVAGWLSDRVGRKPVIVGVYIGGAIGFAIFLLAGSSLAGLWAGIVVMGLF
jgi:MFS family permease